MHAAAMRVPPPLPRVNLALFTLSHSCVSAFHHGVMCDTCALILDFPASRTARKYISSLSELPNVQCFVRHMDEAEVDADEP